MKDPNYPATLASATWIVLEGITTGVPLRQVVDTALQLALREARQDETPVDRARRDADATSQGICIALHVMHSFGYENAWRELVYATGEKEITYYAAHVEPDEWELAGFKAWARRVLNVKKPRRRKS